MTNLADISFRQKKKTNLVRRLQSRSDRLVVLQVITGLCVFFLSVSWPYEQYAPLRTGLFCSGCFWIGFSLIQSGTMRFKTLAVALFIIKFLSSYPVLIFGWFHAVDHGRESVYRGFDPITYDTLASWIAQSGQPLSDFMDPEGMGNYPYIIQFYSIVYRIAGASVLNAAAVNSLLVALGYYFYIKAARLLGADAYVEKFLAFMFIVPEIIYFTALPGKDATSIALGGAVTFLVLNVRLRAGVKNVSNRKNLLAVLVIIGLLFIRLQVFIVTMVVTCAIRVAEKGSPQKGLFLSCALLAAIVVSGAFVSKIPFPEPIAQLLGSGLVFSQDDVNDMERRYQDNGDTILKDDSITGKLIPYTPAQSVLYSPIRALFYLIYPFLRPK